MHGRGASGSSACVAQLLSGLHRIRAADDDNHVELEQLTEQLEHLLGDLLIDRAALMCGMFGPGMPDILGADVRLPSTLK